MPYYPDPSCDLCKGKGKRKIKFGKDTCIFSDCDCLVFAHSLYCPVVTYKNAECNCKWVVDYGEVLQRTKR